MALEVKNLVVNAADLRNAGSQGRDDPLEKGMATQSTILVNGYPLHYSCLENPMDRGAWQTMVHGVARVGHDLATKPPPP